MAMGEFLGDRRKEYLAVYVKNSTRPCRRRHGLVEFSADNLDEKIMKK